MVMEQTNAMGGYVKDIQFFGMHFQNSIARFI